MEQQARAGAIDARMAKIDSVSVLQPDKLASVDGRRAARAMLHQLQSILVDRRANAHIDIVEAKACDTRGLPPDGTQVHHIRRIRRASHATLILPTS